MGKKFLGQNVAIFDEKVKAIDLQNWPKMDQIFEKFFFDFFSFLGCPESIEHKKNFFWEKNFWAKICQFLTEK